MTTPATTSGDFRKLLGLPERSIDRIEGEMDRKPHLPGDLRHERQTAQAETRDARQVKTATEAMARIPGPGEAFHLAISGRFALWHFVEAALSLAECKIDMLHIATLGFSKKNIEAMTQLVDRGDIQRVRLLCSHYFKNTSKPIYQHAVSAFEARPDRMEFLSIRTHAKILLLAFEDGRRITVESSANLRSCKNIEQVAIIGDPGLHSFHRQWIDDLFGGPDHAAHPAA